MACFFAGSASAATINVPADQSTIQAAIDAANDGDTVLVAPGTYYEQIVIYGKNITVKSSGGAAVTILDGSNTSPIISIGASNTSVLQGFTLTHASTIINGVSAAVLMGDDAPTIEDNVFVDNSVDVDNPGASAIFGDDASAVIVRNYFVDNAGAGVVTLLAGSSVVADNVFVNNSAVACWVQGGAPRIYNNTMVGNTQGLYLAPVDSLPGSSFASNLIAFNQVGLANGGDSQVPFSNNLVYGNTTADYQGIVSQTGANGNISAAPNMKDWGNGDVHLLSGSPAIDAGDSAVSQASATDFYGSTRVYAGIANDSAIVDIGAAESIVPDGSQPASTVINVPSDQPTIQAAINAAHNTYTVAVAPGTYYEQINFDGKPITVKSSGGAASTILDGSNNGPIVRFHNGEGNASVLQGFTLTHAVSTASSGFAAVAITEASPTIEDNVFVDNADGLGSGAAIFGFSSSPVIVRNYFANNAATGDAFDFGQVIYLYSGSPVVADNVFVNNSAIACYEEPISGDAPQTYNNTMVGNTMGLEVLPDSNNPGASFSNNLIAFNQVGVNMGLQPGATLPPVNNNLVYGNTTADYRSIESQTGLNGNISVDPKLKDWVNGDVYLLYSSLAIDAGDSAVTQASSTDFYGNGRLSIGNPNGSSVVDIGAVEYSPPVASAVSGALQVQLNAAKTGKLGSSGADSTEPLTFVITSLPAHGTLTLTDAATGAIRYVPVAGYAGTDSFTFHVTDPYGTVSAAATEQVTIQDIAPTANDGSIATPNLFDVSAALSATTAYTGQNLKYAIVSNPSHGTVDVDSTGGVFHYTPTLGYFGPDSFTFDVTDQYGTTSNVATERVTVQDVAPAAITFTWANYAGQAFVGTLPVTLTSRGQTLTYSILSQPAHGAVTLDVDTGHVTYTPTTGYTGFDTFTYNATDAYGLTSNTATAYIAVIDVMPSAAGGGVNAIPGIATDGTLSATAAYAGQALNFSVVSQPAHGNVTVTNAAKGTFRYVPAQGYAGPDSFTFKVTDQYGSSSATATEQITVADIAATANDRSFNILPNVTLSAALKATTAYIGQTLTYSIVSNPSHGTVSTDATGRFYYKPVQNYLGTDSFTFDVTDQDASLSNIATVHVTMADIAPTATGRSLSTTPNTAVSSMLSAARRYPSQTLTFSLVAPPAHGSVSLNAGTGKFTYTPATSFAGTDSFTFQATDPVGTPSNVATINVSVTDIAPKADSLLLKLQPHTSSYSGILKAAAAYGAQTLTYQSVGTPSHGTLTITNPSTGAYTLTATPALNNASSFKFQVVDQWGMVSNTATVTVLVL